MTSQEMDITPTRAAAREAVRRLRDAFPAHRWTDGVLREWVQALTTIGDPGLITQAVTQAIHEHDDRYPPPIARVVTTARHALAAAKARAASHDAGDRHRLTAEMPVNGQECGCGAPLIYLTAPRILWCNTCQAVQVMEDTDTTLRVRLDDQELHALRFGPAKNLTRHMWPEPEGYEIPAAA